MGRILCAPDKIKTVAGSQYSSSMADDLRSWLQFRRWKIVHIILKPMGLWKVDMSTCRRHETSQSFGVREANYGDLELVLTLSATYYEWYGEWIEVGTQPTKVIFGDVTSSDVVIGLPESNGSIDQWWITWLNSAGSKTYQGYEEIFK
jgi:hypothetical protein